MNELKACPLCGGKADMAIAVNYFKSGLSSLGWYVECQNCHWRQSPYGSDHDAIEAWNRYLGEVNKMNELERKTMLNLVDTLRGEINRMCVTNGLAEFDTMYGHAKENLDKLSKLIYDSRFKEFK